METLLRDLRIAFRKILRSPGLTLVVVLSLGLAIGVNTAVFTFLNTILLRPLPFEDPDNLVRLREAFVEDGQPDPIATAPVTYMGWAESQRPLAGVAAQEPTSFSLTGDGDPIYIRGGTITANFLSVLGVAPALGRDLEPEEDLAGNPARVVLLSHGLWNRRYGGDANVLGKKMTLNQEDFTIIGVMPPRFRYPYAAEVWVPMGLDPLGDDRREVRYLNVIARLLPGVTPNLAQAELTAASQRLAEENPDLYQGWSVDAETVREDMVGDVRPALLALFAAASFVLLIAAINAANLLLARSLEQTSEVALQLSIGARRGHLVRQFLTQSLLLAVLACGFGLVLAASTLRILAAMSPLEDMDVFFRESLSLDLRVLVLTILVSLGIGVFFGLLPAWNASRTRLQEVMVESGRSLTSSRGRRWLNVLVVFEIALAVILLAGAGLTFKSLKQQRSIELGFDEQNLLALPLTLPESRYPDREQQVAFYTQLTEQLEQRPGIAFAAMTTDHGSTGQDVLAPFITEDAPPETPNDYFHANHRVITPGYFKTMGIPLIEGRVFTNQDRTGNEAVVIISETFAKKHWPNQSAVGKRTRPPVEGYPWLTVVGVVNDIQDYGDYEETWYVPMFQDYWRFPDMYLMVRTESAPLNHVDTIREAVWALDANQPVDSIRTMESAAFESLRDQRFSTLLFVAFGTLALIVAAVGIFGVISYSVATRFKEFGIRVALGAEPASLWKLVLRQALVQSWIGMLLGTVAALLLTRFLTKMLYGVSPNDPIIFISVLAGLSVVAAAASLLPAYRASRIEPTTVLNHK